MATWNAIATSPLVENERQPLIDSKGVQPTSSSTNISINASNPESAAVERGLSACDEVVVELPDPAARGKTELHLRSFFLTLGPAVTLAVFFAGTGGWIHKVTPFECTTDDDMFKPDLHCNVWNFYALFFSLYGVYLLECCCSKTGRYTCNVADTIPMEAYYMKMISVKPFVQWKIECYHEVSTWDASTQSYQTEDKVTRRATGVYPLSGWSDASAPMPVVSTFSAMTMVDFTTKYVWRNTEAKRKHDAAEVEWIRKNDTDKKKRTKRIWVLPGFQPHIVALRPGYSVPWYFGTCWYLLFSLALLSWPYRVWISLISGAGKGAFRKIVW